MALEKHFTQEWKSISAAAAESENISGCFDCNICLDFARDPVVTLCGHLYCWPCIYKWFHFQTASLDSDVHPQCPVCKAEISDTKMVPLYGGGLSSNQGELEGKTPSLSVAIPPRPSACGAHALMTTYQPAQQLPYHNHYQDQHYPPQSYAGYEDDSSMRSFSLSSSMTTGSFHSGAGMLGEMVYSRVFGNSESLYTYPNSYHLVSSSSPRLRRQEMQADRSLNRITFFLFCCFMLCLLLF